MKELQIFNYKSNEVRTVEVDGEPWFVLKDVCAVLGIADHKVAARRLEEDEVCQIPLTDSLGRMQETSIINESGLYNVILRSDKPEAKPFRKWVTSEVIPSIRKTGGYGTPAMFSTLSPQLQALINIEMCQQEHEKRMALMEEKQQHFDDAFKSAMETMAAPTVNRDAWRGEINHSVRQMCAENGLNYQKTISDMYAELEEKAGVSLSRRQANLRERMRIGGAKYAQREAITKLHVIAEDKKLREIYAGIVRQRSARLIAARPQMRH